MSGRVHAFALWSLVCLTSAAHAKPELALPSSKAPRDLHMRHPALRVAADSEETTSDAEADDEKKSDRGIFGLPTGRDLDLERGGLDRLKRYQLEQDVDLPPGNLSDKVVFRFNLGVGMDGGQPNGEPTLSGAQLDERVNYERLRTYSFVDTVLGSRSAGVDGLNSYLAAHFRYNQRFEQNATAIPSNYDNIDDPLIRSAYAELDEFFEMRAFRPVYMRAGRMFKYGLSVVHFDGITIGYDTPGVKVSAFGGERASMYRLDRNDVSDSAVSGIDARVDLFELKSWPLVFFASSMTADARDHFRFGGALRWSTDVLVSSSLRLIDGSMARSDVSAQARLSEVTTLNLRLVNRTSNDWMYGMWQLDVPDSSADARRYLDLGPVLPRSLLSIRYGTVLLQNIDLLVRVGGALDRRDRDTDPASSFSSSFAESGAALEVQIRRALRLGASLLGRKYFIGSDKTQGIPGQPDPLPAAGTGAHGVSSFWEGGTNFIYSPGARQFRATAELYGRRYSYRSEQLLDNTNDVRTGGRFSLEGWLFRRLRVRAEYDVSFNTLLMAPELRGLKSLRVLVEGSF